MKKRMIALLFNVFCIFLNLIPIYAKDIPQEEIADYKVSFYAFTPFNLNNSSKH